MSAEDIKTVVQEKYGAAAKRAASGQGSTCCGTSPASTIEGCDPITSHLYGEGEAGSVPEAALRASLGCSNPTAFAKLEPGEVVLNLGARGGIDMCRDICWTYDEQKTEHNNGRLSCNMT